MICLILFCEHVVSCGLGREDKVRPVSYNLRDLVEIHMIQAVLVSFERTIVLKIIIAHHICTAVSVGSTETY